MKIDVTLRVSFDPLIIKHQSDTQTALIKKLRRKIMSLETEVEGAEREAAELEAENEQLKVYAADKDAAIAERDALIEELRQSQADPGLVERLSVAVQKLDTANAAIVKTLSPTPPDEEPPPPTDGS